MKIDFNKNTEGLVPAIIQDSTSKNVLMLGFMNQEALEITQNTKKVTFFSRTKNRLMLGFIFDKSGRGRWNTL